MLRIINDGAKTIALTNTQVVEAQYSGSQRKVIVLTNTSTLGETISISFGKEAKTGQGIYLSQGASYVASADSGYNPPNDRVNAIASAATATLAFHEEIDKEV